MKCLIRSPWLSDVRCELMSLPPGGRSEVLVLSPPAPRPVNHYLLVCSVPCLLHALLTGDAVGDNLRRPVAFPLSSCLCKLRMPKRKKTTSRLKDFFFFSEKKKRLTLGFYRDNLIPPEFILLLYFFVHVVHWRLWRNKYHKVWFMYPRVADVMTLSYEEVSKSRMSNIQNRADPEETNEKTQNIKKKGRNMVVHKSIVRGFRKPPLKIWHFYVRSMEFVEPPD